MRSACLLLHLLSSLPFLQFLLLLLLLQLFLLLLLRLLLQLLLLLQLPLPLLLLLLAVLLLLFLFMLAVFALVCIHPEQLEPSAPIIGFPVLCITLGRMSKHDERCLTQA